MTTTATEDTGMTTRALVLVHDPAADRRERIPGALLPALSTRSVKHEIISFVGAESEPDLRDYDLLVVMGSRESAYDDTVPWLPRELAFVGAAVDHGLPVLGICFGGQLLARHLGGSVGPAAVPEFGFTTVGTSDPDLVARGPWMQFHGDAFVPPVGTEIARNASGSQAFLAGKVLGVQFHPEITRDSFDSWIERWDAEGDTPAGAVDVAALRAAVARHERRSALLCDRLVGTFLERTLR
ncbi:type 1 glutamine amidotransferase [Amycolatopsis thermophila]|uniref:GMP synthase-like glutamine amidotransferase n=1 Tax=Amycolatopsis thermophila TaxID=206084 RepID=A0ABU0F1W0_9PSEU|nr:type 1 glutamine amidotransferase [Amycolatopsis thermophila]MDQ0381571.1 GMP synthase-like glutamine amidotransferase [Amycolatopsis thermophila]